VPYEAIQLERHLAHLSRDFIIELKETKLGPALKLGKFKAFIGQDNHERHEAFAHRAGRSRISWSAAPNPHTGSFLVSLD
jgi:DNA (cytosine-5)-methyltransferase 1